MPPQHSTLAWGCQLPELLADKNFLWLPSLGLGAHCTGILWAHWGVGLVILFYLAVVMEQYWAPSEMVQTVPC
eukprot:3793896-Ditylum_brightwellii.AAC.1